MHPVDEMDATAEPGCDIGAARDRGERIEVGKDHLDDAGALHLDRDCAAVAQGRTMHLRERGAPERNIIETLEEMARPHAEFAFDHRAHVGHRQRGDSILGAFQCGQIRLRQHVRACG